MARELALEDLLGQKVIDSDGRHAGRVEEIHARRRGDEMVVAEYVLGAAGLVERLSLGPVLRAILGTRLYPEAARYTIDWTEVDLSEPTTPRLTCRVADLERRLRARRPPRRASA